MTGFHRTDFPSVSLPPQELSLYRPVTDKACTSEGGDAGLLLPSSQLISQKLGTQSLTVLPPEDIL